tara:strand:+ start:747 stop:926 length:180 start_codon:yes stop_codon:yes gene_type:complete
MIRYLNTKLNGVIETLDSLERNDFATYKEFIKEIKRLKHEYIISGYGGVYISQRACKDY